MRNSDSKKRISNIQTQCNEIAQSFARLSLEIGELVHEDSESDKSIDYTELPKECDIISTINKQIAIVTQVKTETDVISGSYKNNRRKEVKNPYSNSVSSGPFTKGERLIITNNYLSLRGLEATVDYTNRKFTVIVDDNNTPHKRAHSNLRRVNKKKL